jgi:hypothetical protein
MKKVIRVAVYGSNVVMSSLCASLQKRPDLEVRRLDAGLSSDEIDAAFPDVILFDLAAGQPDFAISAMQKNPTMLLVGVDLTSHKMLVLSGEQSHLLTADDLVRVVGQTRGNVEQTDRKRNNSMPIVKG